MTAPVLQVALFKFNNHFHEYRTKSAKVMTVKAIFQYLYFSSIFKEITVKIK